MTAPQYQNRITRHGTERADQLLANPWNWRIHTKHQRTVLDETLREVGWIQSVIVNETTGHIIDGHLRVSLALPDNQEVPVVYVKLDEHEEKLALALTDSITALADTDNTLLDDLIAQTSTDSESLQAFLDSLRSQDAKDEEIKTAARMSLAEQFLVPPFSVLDARQGYWQDRKRMWLALGIRSELGRGQDGDKADNGLTFSVSSQPGDVWDRKAQLEQRDGRTYTWTEFAKAYPEEIRLVGDSIFDPVLCEIAVRWFAPHRARVLDPFAGGSVRGIVAAISGAEYLGIDLRKEQIAANQANWHEVTSHKAESPDYTPDQTPVERRGKNWAKRDDLYTIAGVSGGKVRTCWALAQGAKGLVTAGSRSSPQVNIVAHIARRLGIPARAHIPKGELGPELIAAKQAGAELIQHPAGYNNVIIKRARDDAEARDGWTEIPFGMECQEAVEQTRRQVANLPFGQFGRIILPAGSGMSLAGVLWGLKDAGQDIPVLGIRVGADPTDRLDAYAPPDWRQTTELRDSGIDYHTPAGKTHWQGLDLDPYYEAKIIPHIEPNDLVWIVGIRQTERAGGLPGTNPPTWITGDSRTELEQDIGKFDLLFSCPPYADLEVYSDDPDDISGMDYPDFLAAYRDIIAKAADKLRDNRFAVWVIGDVRDKDGNYRNLIGDTVAAFHDAGLTLYNEAIYIQATGSLAMRAGRMFRASRKLGKSHQNVMVFLKGGIPDDTPAPEDIGKAVAEQFASHREFLDAHAKMLVFLKGSAKKATEALPAVAIAETEQ